MTRSPGAVTKEELHAFVDGQLDEARHRVLLERVNNRGRL